MDHADSPSASESRRTFLHRSVVTGAVAVPTILTASKVGLAKPTKVKSTQGTVTQQRTSSAVSNRREPSLRPGENNRAFQEIQADEDAHVAFILQALGSNARPKPTFQGLDGLSYGQFIQLSQTFENTGVGAYLGAAPYIQDKKLLAEVGSIAFVEAYHSGYLNTLVGQSILPNGSSFAMPLTFDQVVTALTPFIADAASLHLAQFPLPTLTNPASITDLNIVNFALVAEYLEREFYDINVPKFYGSRR